MMTKEEVVALRERLIQSKHDYYGGAYEIWVAEMELVNKILQIDTGTGSICGGEIP